MALSEQLKKEYPFKSNFLDLDGKQYHFIDEGEGDAIVMVHGNPTWSFYYRNLVKELSKNYRVIVPDHMGCGLSEKPQDYEYTLKNHVGNLNKLLKFLDVKNYSMVVHDWGGAIGFGHAVDHVDNINKMVILNTAAFRSKRIPFTIGLCKNKVFGSFITKYLNAFAYPATFMTTEKKLSSVAKEGYLYPYSNPKNRIAVAEFVRDIPMNESHRSYETLKSIEDKLPNLKGQKLILWGGRDFCFNDEFFTRWKEIYPTAFHKYYKDAGHYVIEDEKEDTLKQIQNFLGQ